MASIADIQVLVVDDNRQARMLLRSMLNAGGVRHIAEAGAGGDAFKALGSGIDLVLLDWQMSPMDGLAFTREVRWRIDSPRPYVPIIMLTAHTEISRVAAARDAGISGFVKKPISAQQLFARISTALTETRLFVRCETFVGPDRRRLLSTAYLGPFRRESDPAPNRWTDSIDLDDLRWSA
ncbi:MAG: response regulator [Terricaulis sp.]|mgnify:CR=1 FL=1